MDLRLRFKQLDRSVESALIPSLDLGNHLPVPHDELLGDALDGDDATAFVGRVDARLHCRPFPSAVIFGPFPDRSRVGDKPMAALAFCGTEPRHPFIQESLDLPGFKPCDHGKLSG